MLACFSLRPRPTEVEERDSRRQNGALKLRLISRYPSVPARCRAIGRLGRLAVGLPSERLATLSTGSRCPSGAEERGASPTRPANRLTASPDHHHRHRIPRLRGSFATVAKGPAAHWLSFPESDGGGLAWPALCTASQAGRMHARIWLLLGDGARLCSNNKLGILNWKRSMPLEQRAATAAVGES